MATFFCLKLVHQSVECFNLFRLVYFFFPYKLDMPMFHFRDDSDLFCSSFFFS